MNNTQIEITPELKKAVEEKINSIPSDKLKSALSFSYGISSQNSEECFVAMNIDPTGKRDWVKAKEEVVFTAPKQYQDSLGSFAVNLLKNKKEQLSKTPEPASTDSSDTNGVFRMLKLSLRKHDWYYNYSDDHSYWKAGNASWNNIKNAVKNASKVDLNKTREIYMSAAPKQFHSDFENLIK
jgi:hypothetical protein